MVGKVLEKVTDDLIERSSVFLLGEMRERARKGGTCVDQVLADIREDYRKGKHIQHLWITDNV